VQNALCEGRFDERNQYFIGSADRAAHDLAALPRAQADTADRRVSITKDVPIVWIDHISIEGELLGMWQAFYSGDVRDFEEVKRCSI
jgi:hypothetical protein